MEKLYRVSAARDPAPKRNRRLPPSGTVTFAFTDIEESTRRWERNPSAMKEAVRRHDRLVREAIVRRKGYVFKTVGDAFCAAFSHPGDAVAAMFDAQRALAAEDFSALDGLRVRAAIHTGTADEREGDYFGPAVNRVARLLAIGHGGQILVSGVASTIVQADLPLESSLRNLGEHRLKDLSAPEEVFQLAAPGLISDFPPLRSLNTRTTNLPLQLTSFVGRETEIAEIASLAREHRLVTLIGSGGVGKTRTALQVAADLHDDLGDGVWLVELASLSSGDNLPSTIAQALGITLAAGSPLEQLIDVLNTKRLLLIFDNCEHLVEPSARVATAILSSCPTVKVIATSRQALEIGGERSYRLPPLAVPTEEDAKHLRAIDALPVAAVALFIERAAAVESRCMLTDENASSIADICRRLDGIPLAIELAASKMAILGVKQISEMLNERFRLLSQTRTDRLARQQTLRAMIDWSFDLLDEEERAVFRRLSIFAGGWTLHSATAVCADENIDQWRVFELLTALVTKSIVVAEPRDDERRYGMLNSIQEYGRERLAAADEVDQAAAKHTRYYARLLLELGDLVDSLEDVQWQHALVPEIDNIRAALDWAVFRRNDVESGLKLLAAIEWPELLTTPQEALQWFVAAAELLDGALDGVSKARVLRHLVRLEWLVGRPIAAREKTATEAVAVAQASQDRNEIARALSNLGSCYRDAGHFEKAESIFGQAYGNPETLSAISANHVLRNWAVTNLQHGDVEAARLRFTEVAQRERPGSEAHASALLNLGELEFALGNVEAARLAANKARETLVRLKAAPTLLVVCNLAAYALAVDDVADARDLLREALRLLRESNARWTITALEHHALLGGVEGDYERAAALLGFTEAYYADGNRRERTERHGYERLIGLLSQAYDPAELAQRLSAGARLKHEQALEYAAAISYFSREERRPSPKKE
jgi:predicted ATPase/class 3 adenylate cyclase